MSRRWYTVIAERCGVQDRRQKGILLSPEEVHELARRVERVHPVLPDRILRALVDYVAEDSVGPNDRKQACLALKFLFDREEYLRASRRRRGIEP